MRLSSTRKIAVLVAALIGLAAVGSAALLFVQTQPAVPSEQMTANCEPTVAIPAIVALGSSGTVTFACSSISPTTMPAFTTTGVVQATPTFSGFGAPYNDIMIYDANGAITTGPCGDRTGANFIQSGVPENNIAADGWNYCARYTNVQTAGLPSFTITWSTP